MANLTLLSLSFNKERDVSATPKQGEVKRYGQKHKGQIVNLPLLLTLHLNLNYFTNIIFLVKT